MLVQDCISDCTKKKEKCAHWLLPGRGQKGVASFYSLSLVNSVAGACYYIHLCSCITLAIYFLPLSPSPAPTLLFCLLVVRTSSSTSSAFYCTRHIILLNASFLLHS